MRRNRLKKRRPNLPGRKQNKRTKLKGVAVLSANETGRIAEIIERVPIFVAGGLEVLHGRLQ